MIQKAYIVSQSEKEPNKFKVRIPVIHGLDSTPSSTRDEDLPYAPVCGIEGIIGVFHPGDVVFVGFENGEFGTPVILGQLMLNLGKPVTEEASKKKITTEAKFNSLTVSGYSNSATPLARLPEDTKIGDITSFEIASLSGVRTNIQAQIDELAGAGPSYSRGLTFSESSTNKYYVSGIGTCQDAYISVPPTTPNGGAVVGISENAFQNNTQIYGITLPDSVEIIGKNALSGCWNLQYVKIGIGVSSIGQDAFDSDIGLTFMHIESPTPPNVSTGAFTNVPFSRIEVPSESVDSYQAAGGWSTYSTYIVAIPE